MAFLPASLILGYEALDLGGRPGAAPSGPLALRIKGSYDLHEAGVLRVKETVRISLATPVPPVV